MSNALLRRARLIVYGYESRSSPREASGQHTKSNIALLRDLTNRIEEAGYSKVRMIPQAAEVEGAQAFIGEATGVDHTE